MIHNKRSRRAKYSPLFEATGAATPWFLHGGVARANCLAAYQPKAAASLSASYLNLAQAGVNNAAPGVAPGWNAADGWIFDGLSQYLDAGGLVPANGWSMIVRFSSVTNNLGMCGEFTSGAAFAITPGVGSGQVVYASGGTLSVAPHLAGGVLAVAGSQGYRDGTPDGGSIPAWSGSATRVIAIGARRGASLSYCAGKLQALAIYNLTLSAGQVAVITAAMQVVS